MIDRTVTPSARLTREPDPSTRERPVYGVGEAAGRLGLQTDRTPAVEGRARNVRRIDERVGAALRCWLGRSNNGDKDGEGIGEVRRFGETELPGDRRDVVG